MDQIESDLKELAYIHRHVQRIFLVNGDAFVLSFRQLKAIAQKIISVFPECQTISMYASIRNIQAKTEQELKELRELRINDLYVGVESGSENVLAYINKGHTVTEAKRELQRLSAAGIEHIANLMLGVAGQHKGLENSKVTASFLNETRPKMIWVGTLAVFEGTPLFADIQAGRFSYPTEREILEEEQELIKLIQVENVRLYATHPSNSVPVSGILPKDKEKLIQKIAEGIQGLGERTLSSKYQRTSL